nr:reverse transcriptase domain-containing protein [Tanacetum cinerariifolium]
MQQKKYVKDPVEIHNIKQRDGETIEDFMERFKIETGRMKGAPECMRIFEFMHGVNNLELTKRLNEHVPKTMEEMMITTTAFIREEAVAASKKKGHMKEITFPPLAASNGTDGPLVIEAEMGGHMIHRMYIDGGSSMEILYEHCFNRLRPEIKSQMVPATTSLTDFSGLKAIQAVPSTVHGMLKFPVEGGIVTICSTILIPTECASVIKSSMVPSEERTRPANFKVALHPDFPDQEVAIGEALSNKGRTKLCSILKKNLDIFAWQPSYMTGVPRSVAEHDSTSEKDTHRIVTHCRRLTGKLNLSAATPSSASWMLTKATTRYSWQKRMKRRHLSTRDKGGGTSLPAVKATLIRASPIAAETQEEPWTLFTDGSSCVDGSGAGIILTSPEGVEFTYALRFQFTASNNKAEYEALVVGLRIATRMGVKNVQAEYVMREIHEGSCSMHAGLRPFFGRAREGQIFNSRHGLLHEVDRSKGSGNNYRRTVDVVNNDEELRLNLDLLEERRERAAIREAKVKSKMTKYYNARVRGIAFKPDMDLFSLIRAPNPTKVKTGSRPRAAHEVPLLTVTANRVIEMEDPAAATDSLGVPSTIKRSQLDFANEAGAADQGTMAPEVLRRDHADPRPTGSTRGEKSLTAIELVMASTNPVPVPESTPADESDPDPLSSQGTIVTGDPESENAPFASVVRSPESIYRPEWGVANGSMLDTPEACQDLVDHVAPPGYFSELRHLRNDDFLRQYNVNLARQVAMGSQLRLRFEQEAKLLKKSVAQVARRDKRIQAREHEIKNLEALLEAEADMKKATKEKNAKLSQELENIRALFLDLQVSNNHLSQQVATLQEQVSGEEKLKDAFEEFKQYEDNRVEQRCAEMDARLDVLSIDFDEELYPHMLTAIAHSRWMIGRGLRLAVMKCGESLKLRQAFADVVSARIAKGVSEGLRHRVEHGQA